MFEVSHVEPVIGITSCKLINCLMEFLDGMIHFVTLFSTIHFEPFLVACPEQLCEPNSNGFLNVNDVCKSKLHNLPF